MMNSMFHLLFNANLCMVEAYTAKPISKIVSILYWCYINPLYVINQSRVYFREINSRKNKENKYF